MKKILILFLMLSIQAIANEQVRLSEKDFLKTLKLSSIQEQKIEVIEKKVNSKISVLNGKILLKDMEMAQLFRNEANSRVQALKREINALQNEVNEVYQEKQNEIAQNLGFFQKIKYKKYLSRAY